MTIIKVSPTKEQSIARTAELFAAMAIEAVEKQGSFHVMLAGGETPRQMYELLAQSPDYQALPWGQIHVYWGDERCVPPDHLLSNQQMVRQSLLNHVAIPEKNIHPIVYDGSPETTARNYENHLRSLFHNEFPQFDLILLGLGDDGHTASLFPGTHVLNNQKDWVGVGYLAGQDMHRITLTIPTINSAKNIAFLVIGSKKAPMVKAVLENDYDAEPLPAQLIKPVRGNVYWIIDQEAATLLHTKKE